MFTFTCSSVKNYNNFSSNFKTFMTMFLIYYGNMWYDLEDRIFRNIH